MVARYADVRRFIDFVGIAFGRVHGNTPHRQAFNTLTQFLQGSTKGRLHTFGKLSDTSSPQNRKQGSVLLAAIYVLENLFHVSGVKVICLGKGIQKLAADRYSKFIVMWKRTIENSVSASYGPQSAVRCSDIIGGEDCDDALLLCAKFDPTSTDAMHYDDHVRNQSLQELSEPQEGSTLESLDDHLSTIPEGTEESFHMQVQEIIEDLERIPEESIEWIDEPLDSDYRDSVPYLGSCPDWVHAVENGGIVQEGLHCYAAGADPSRLNCCESDESGNEYITYYLENNLHKLVLPWPQRYNS